MGAMPTGGQSVNLKSKLEASRVSSQVDASSLSSLAAQGRRAPDNG